MKRGLDAFDETALAMWGSTLAGALKKGRVRQNELARRMRVSPPYISAVLSGDNLTLTQASRLLWACGFEIRITAVPRFKARKRVSK